MTEPAPMMMQSARIALVLAALLAACGDGGSGQELTISAQPLTGTFGGAPWTLAGARAEAGFEPNEVHIELHPVAVEACSSGASPSPKFILFFTQAVVGSYSFSLSQNATFVTEMEMQTPHNLVSLNGKVRIDEVTATTIKGGIVAEADSQNSVSGTFEAQRCPR